MPRNMRFRFLDNSTNSEQGINLMSGEISEGISESSEAKQGNGVPGIPRSKLSTPDRLAIGSANLWDPTMDHAEIETVRAAFSDPGSQLGYSPDPSSDGDSELLDGVVQISPYSRVVAGDAALVLRLAVGWVRMGPQHACPRLPLHRSY
jgi:hypothetical protein